MNFLAMINDVLVRLREPQIAVIGETPYSEMIGVFLNDAKRRVESAHNWMALSTTATVTTLNGVSEYILDDVGTRFKVIGVYNETSKFELDLMPQKELTRLLRDPSPQRGSAAYYGFNGVAASGVSGSAIQRRDHDPVVTLFPVPTTTEIVHFDLYAPTDEMVQDIDSPLLPSHLLIDYAYAKAIAERGEDGSISASEAAAMWSLDLSDEIAIEASRFPDQLIWIGV
jgi:hypothetical protein